MDIPASDPAPLYPRTADIPDSFARGLPASGRRARIGIVFGSSFNWPQKKWPWERYADLITILARDGHEFVLLGAPGEKEEASRISGKAQGPVTDTTGALDYAGLVREVAACDLVVGNDTGTLHLAAACGVATVTLFGPTDPRKWNPIGSTAVFLEHIPCRPCYYLGSMPPCNHFSCLRQMEAGVVAEAVRGRLAGKAAPAHV
jgi:ADP-heptose:LPS heptosyltransferase